MKPQSDSKITELALSTAWRSPLHRNPDELLGELLTSGLNRFELEYRLEKETVDRLAKLAAKGVFAISSLHNYCPHPEVKPWEEAGGDCFSLAAVDKNERSLAVTYTKRTIEYAKKLGASTVVLHLGTIEMDQARPLFMKILDRNEQEADWAKHFMGDFVRERSSRRRRNLEALVAALDILVPFAESRKVMLGIENRYYLGQIPDLEELKFLLKRYPRKSVGYWHDVGHAQVHTNLRLPGNPELLAKFGSRLVGCHIHDCTGRVDHRAPGMGAVDFKALAPYLSKAPIKVLEIKSVVTVAEIERGIAVLKSAGILTQ